MSSAYDPTDPEIRRDPHALFARLRAEEPVHWSPRLAGWVVTSHELAVKVLTLNGIFSADRFAPFQERLSGAARATAAEVLRWFNHWMVFRDPPEHTRLRRHLANVFNATAFDAQRPNVSAVVHELLDRIPRGQDCDFYQAFSLWMPGMVVGDLMGVERSRLLDVKGWSEDMMTFIGSVRDMPDKYERARRGANAMGQYFGELIARRRAEPCGDPLSQLVASEINGERLSDDEVVASMMMVLNGGHETTANMINNALLALAAHPEAWAGLRRDQGRVATAVEEFLRYDGPVLSIGRLVVQDTELGGQPIKSGDRIFAMLVAANRDPAVFKEPDRLDPARAPNPHIAFGKGPHFCLGTPLARIEGQIALRALLERYDHIELREPRESIPWHNSMVMRGPSRLPLRLY